VRLYSIIFNWEEGKSVVKKPLAVAAFAPIRLLTLAADAAR
jgi:hypothetical protein